MPQTKHPKHDDDDDNSIPIPSLKTFTIKAIVDFVRGPLVRTVTQRIRSAPNVQAQDDLLQYATTTLHDYLRKRVPIHLQPECVELLFVGFEAYHNAHLSTVHRLQAAAADRTRAQPPQQQAPPQQQQQQQQQQLQLPAINFGAATGNNNRRPRNRNRRNRRRGGRNPRHNQLYTWYPLNNQPVPNLNHCHILYALCHTVLASLNSCPTFTYPRHSGALACNFIPNVLAHMHCLTTLDMRNLTPAFIHQLPMRLLFQLHRALAAMPLLTKLCLPTATNETLRIVASACRQLQWLEVAAGTPASYSSHGIGQLQRMRQLRVLRLDGPAMTVGTMATMLRRMGNRLVDVGETDEVAWKMLAALALLQNSKRRNWGPLALRKFRRRLKDGGELPVLTRGLPQLRWVDVSLERAYGADARLMAAWTEMRSLKVMGNYALKDREWLVEVIRAMPELRELHLQAVDDCDVQAIAAERPHLEKLVLRSCTARLGQGYQRFAATVPSAFRAAFGHLRHLQVEHIVTHTGGAGNEDEVFEWLLASCPLVERVVLTHVVDPPAMLRRVLRRNPLHWVTQMRVAGGTWDEWLLNREVGGADVRFEDFELYLADGELY